jgi:CBS domain-containing protein
MNVGNICNRKVIFADVGTNLLDASKLMREHHVGSLIATRRETGGDRPLGIITDRDLVVEVMAEEIEPQSVTLEDAMTRHPLIAYESDDVYEVLERMREKGVRRIPVVNSEDYLVGVLAIDDILRMIFHELGNLVSLVKKEYETELKLRKAV